MLLNISIRAQNTDGCNGTRYANEVFSSTTQVTVKYGENLNFGISEELFMDVFEPENDTLTKRPVVVFAHGGFFLFGSRADMHDMCIEYAKRGYVSATIDYRKLQPGTVGDSINAVEVMVRTMQDMKAAVRYFRNDSKNDNVFKIDTAFVFVGGYSAGAIMALHTAYWSEGDNNVDYINEILMSEGGLEGQSNNILDVSSQVQGVISHSGAILKNEWIQVAEPPIVSYHGTNDAIINFGTALFANAIVLDGSEIIHQRASQEGVPNYLYAVPGGGHTDIYDAIHIDDFNTYMDSSFVFFEEILCDQMVSIPSNVFTEDNVVLFPNPVSNILGIQHNGNGDLEISIFDRLGRSIGNWKLIANTTTIHLNHVNSGIYFYLIKTRSGNDYQNGKLIINHR